MKFNSYELNKKKQFLDEKAANNKDLVNRWILGKPKNLYYKHDNKNNITKKDLEYYALLNWIIPDEEFTYREISIKNQTEEDLIDEYCNITTPKLKRSSIIPFVYFNNENHWLLGSFHDYKDTGNPILADFAGKCEKQDNNNECPPLECAMRELKEESKGLLQDIVRYYAKNINRLVIFKGKNKKEEIIYFMFVKLDYKDVKDIPAKFLQEKEENEKLGPLNFYKQSDILNRTYRTSKNLTDLVRMLKP